MRVALTYSRIEPAKGYPEDYFETVEQVRQERDNGYEPPLTTQVGSPDCEPSSTTRLPSRFFDRSACLMITITLNSRCVRDVPEAEGWENGLAVRRTHRQHSSWPTVFFDPC